jgi:DNA-binding protein Fis
MPATISITMDQIIKVCHLTAEEASRELGMCRNTLSARVREAGKVRGYEDIPAKWGSGLYKYFVERGDIPRAVTTVCLNRSGPTKPVTLDEIHHVSHLTQVEAAREPGICQNTLRTRLYDYNIKSWRSLESQATGDSGLFDSLFKFIISPPTPQTQELPPGWAAREDAASGRIYYEDNMGHTTTWERPGKQACPTFMRPFVRLCALKMLLLMLIRL